MTWTESREFIVGDVVEWTEAMWPPKRGKKKQRPLGEQKAIGQIAEIDGDFIKITVLKSEITKNDAIKDLYSHKVGTTIARKRATLLRGKPERLLWSEEEVRATLLTPPAAGNNK